MKMVKSLLLGSAAGLVAIAGAQAADLPVKAKPVQYVKICSLYGVGFYYIPGTDTCIKIGGWVREQYMFGAEDGSNGPMNIAAATNEGLADRVSQGSGGGYTFRARGYITADAREQTAYGTVRAYIDVGRSGDQGGVFSSNRAFIQWAGFTFGLASSFYDFYSGPAVSYWGAAINPSEDTGDAGNFEAAYTAQFGNGLSATIAAEDPLANRRGFVWSATSTAGVATNMSFGAAPANTYDGLSWPDVVANLRVDQAWGSAQIMGALHDTSATYYGGNAGTTGNGHPGNDMGWAVGAGLKLNAPMIGKGDYFQGEVNYAVGANGYVDAGIGAKIYGAAHPGGTIGYGFGADAVYSGVPGSSLNLTTAWGVNASYEHFWNAQWKTSLYGMYMNYDYNNTANTLLCNSQVAGATASGTVGSVISGTCNNDWSYWTVGSRTQWNVTKNFYMGVDVIYTKLQTASNGLVANFAAIGAQSTGVRTVQDQDAWLGYFRVHYDFYP
jgi:hypothetical protein